MAVSRHERFLHVSLVGETSFTVVTRHQVTRVLLDYPNFVRASARSRITGQFREPLLDIARIEAVASPRDKCGQLLLPFDHRRDAARRLLDAIPSDARAICRTLSASATAGVLRLLAACESSRAARELATSNLALLVGVAHHVFLGVGRAWNASLARRLVLTRRAEVLRVLGFPPETERTLRRVEPLAATPYRLLTLRDACQDRRVAKVLRHMPTLTAPVVDAIGIREIAGLISFKFLEELAEARLRGYAVVAQLRELVEARTSLETILRRPLSLQRLLSFRQVAGLIDDLRIRRTQA